ncbi:acyl-[acyl-carrier-protein]-phospholipid O-acyltransferase / long-chain-fatty-acid--[acyl-carrier-protein] ligase [Nitrosomonas sp. Nm51]|uniref:acyl-[ACP]--phospholipid O-acyltransferase n=1 Tax=Nitrosomonas sp. Nm51 TaxID=133720 RepID=UPI0008CDA0B0|nr:acyl-[ACP]--phospholipid O-acyltransferase [Nitrosomonas sp. Nm51]SER51209.1 acyl-[acyl-carrier-protein]-phospholipid O-acyltransferase / long-chain-fatty-acid--[acyl-carrier-protein] ligase [Nitrosomonas sp. Nm51]
MHSDQWHLLKTRRFLPLFISQFLGAFNDNIFKNALIILITYTVIEQSLFSPPVMITLAAGVFILPFFLFSAIAGQLADKYDKARLVRIIKFIEIVLMLGAAMGFYLQQTWLLMLILFLMGTQSAFFGPLKYSILPDQLQENELIGGNALIDSSTFIAILLGTICGGLLIMTENGVLMISVAVIVAAVLGLVSSLLIPPVRPADATLIIQYNVVRETLAIIRHVRQHPVIFRCILGISWFWLFGASFLSQFPTFAKAVVGGNAQVVTLFLATFTIGIAIGSLLCNRLLKSEVAATYVPLGILGMTVFTVDMYWTSHQLVRSDTEVLIGAAVFLESLMHWRILVDLLGIAVCGGIYIVPLYAIIQERAEKSHMSRVFAANNILNALFMVFSAAGISVLLANDFSVAEVFLVIAVINAVVAVYIVTLLPAAPVKSMLRWVFHLCYQLEVKRAESLRHISKNTMIIANHLSYLDAALIAAIVPDHVSFVTNSTHAARRRWLRPFLFPADTITLDMSNPMSMRLLIDRVKKGHSIVIFPEGRLTVTGSLMEVYEGLALIADKAAATIMPIMISGAQYTPFSKLYGKVRIQLFPKITLTVMPQVQFDLPSGLRGKKRRKMAGIRLYDVMSDMMFQSHNLNQTMFQALLDARSIYGNGHLIAEDIERKPVTYAQLALRSFILGAVLKKLVNKHEPIGILLPNMVSTLLCFFGLLAYERVPAMLNYSTSESNLFSACKTAAVHTVITSKRFIHVAKLGHLVKNLESRQINIVYLEELANRISVFDKIRGWFANLMPRFSCRFMRKSPNADAAAVILFTSGSEAVPKGVVLSHKNILANCYQVASRIDFGPSDIAFNALPIFHSFGLTAGTCLPVLSGVRTFLYPSPLHYRVIPELVCDTSATLMFGTDTFLSGYARFARDSDFQSVRYVFAGAEKLREENRGHWADKFGAPIFEGYGATETAPVLSLNTPMHSKPGSVGRLLPGMNYRLEPVAGIHDGGKLLVSGPNIMKGYYLPERPGVLQPPEDDWYDTGDIVSVDEMGYLTIKGRVKRFAKVGGEMVSLTAVEDYINELWPNDSHAAVHLPDPKKGEQIVLVTTYMEAQREMLISYAQQRGIRELSIPKTILTIDEVPLLATGKVDYVALREWVESKIYIA